VTADVYLRRLGWFCKRQGLSPQKHVAMEQKELENLLLDLSELEEQGKAGSYIESIIKEVLALLQSTRTEGVKIRARDAPSLREGRVPTKTELLRIFLAGDKKTRTAAALVAFAGVRLETLENYNGNDGLRIGDFPEMRVEDGRVVFERIPPLVVVRESPSKAGALTTSFR
jgi:hypothetical protein